MNNNIFEKHPPSTMRGIVGCNGYSNTKSLICLLANGDNNFLLDGIVEDSILFIDTTALFEDGLLNVFKFPYENSPQYKLSKVYLSDLIFVGKVVMSIKQYQ